MKMLSRLLVLSLMLAAGCATSYTWRSRVPAEMRSVYVPTFVNETDVMELGAISTRQILREFQREGTFSLASREDAALEVQGTILGVSANSTGYDRRMYLRFSARELTLLANISVIDRRTGAILVNNQRMTASTTMVTGQDYTTAIRDASGRLADDLARQVVDQVLNLKF